MWLSYRGWDDVGGWLTYPPRLMSLLAGALTANQSPHRVGWVGSFQSYAPVLEISRVLDTSTTRVFSKILLGWRSILPILPYI